MTAREIFENALIMSGYGINSEMDTREALARAGMDADIVHINDLIAGKQNVFLPTACGLTGGFFLWG